MSKHIYNIRYIALLLPVILFIFQDIVYAGKKQDLVEIPIEHRILSDDQNAYEYFDPIRSDPAAIKKQTDLEKQISGQFKKEYSEQVRNRDIDRWENYMSISLLKPYMKKPERMIKSIYWKTEGTGEENSIDCTDSEDELKKIKDKLSFALAFGTRYKKKYNFEFEILQLRSEFPAGSNFRAYNCLNNLKFNTV